MFKTFFLSEIKYALKQPMIYIFMGILALLVFGAVSSDNVTIGGSVGNVHRNAPFIITLYTSIMTIFGLIMATAFFNNAALKDYSNNFNEILFSTPLSKAGYFFGRFFAALILSTVPMLGVFIGVLLGTVLAPLFGWLDAERFGSFFFETFVNNYFLFILPNMFFAGAIIFALANRWKSTVISFVGSLAIIMAYTISGTFMSDIDNETIAALADTFGVRTYSYITKYYTPIEKNGLSPQFSGILLWNRLIWIGLGLIILFISYFNFSFQSKNKKVSKPKESKERKKISFTKPILSPTFNNNTEWKQFKSFFKMNLLSITKSVTFKILFLFSAIILFSNLYGGFEYFGLKSYPLTYKMFDLIDQSGGLFVMIILVFFSGELIWRDRNNKINEVVDSTPHGSLITLFAKSLSLVTVTALLHGFFIVICVLYQLLNGFTEINFFTYIQDFFYGEFFVYLVWSAVLILIQVLVNNKYLGYFVSFLFIFALEIIISLLDIQTNMVSIGAGPSLMYSDMNQFGPGVTGAMWFNIYWGLFALICLLIAGAVWNRGVNSSLVERFKTIKKQVPKNYRMLVIGSTILWLGVAGFVFYNTQILNNYKTGDEREKISAEYEKRYKKYEHIATPKIVDAKYFIDIFPYKRDVHVKAIMKLSNTTNSVIDSIHFNLDRSWDPEIIIPNSTVVLHDKEVEYLIIKLDQALQPNDTISIEINTNYITNGFENTTGNTNIVKNGTFINNFEILPDLGYQSGVEISDKHTRKKYDLKPKDRMPILESDCNQHCNSNYLTNGRSDFINVETTISTSIDQIAIAPGSLIRKWEENGRNYYHYEVDHPSQNFYSFISAKYEVAVRKWKDVNIEVYYDKKHDVNIEMMLDAVERSLTYYDKNFGPYFHKQCRIIEFPRYATFAQAFPGTMPYSEGFGFTTNLENEKDNNVIDAVIAHEMAHQWWAHQVIGANMQGGTMMSESFSEYSSLMTMKNISNDPMKMREFLKYDHNRYLRGRSGETEKELPLYKVENQSHIHYGKGSVILYALQDYIGEDKVNLAMKNFLNEFKYKAPPYPTSHDFIRHLEPVVPDSLNYLIKDWFKEITLYDNRLKNANYKELPNGKYQITLETESYKIKADSIGNETKVAINDWVDIGVFADSDEKELILEKRVKINQTNMTFQLEVDQLPVRAGIDPKMLLIDRVYKDNIKKVVKIE